MAAVGVCQAWEAWAVSEVSTDIMLLNVEWQCTGLGGMMGGLGGLFGGMGGGGGGGAGAGPAPGAGANPPPPKPSSTTDDLD